MFQWVQPNESVSPVGAYKFSWVSPMLPSEGAWVFVDSFVSPQFPRASGFISWEGIIEGARERTVVR